jgi:hypothetical protein
LQRAENGYNHSALFLWISEASGGIKAMDQNQGINRGMAKISSRMNQDESLSQALIVSEASDRISSRGMASWPLMDKSGSSIKGILAMGSKGSSRAEAI